VKIVNTGKLDSW